VEPGKGGPSATPESPSKTFSPQQDCLYEEGEDLAVGASQRPNSLGLPSQIPTMRPRYKADPKSPSERPPEEAIESSLPKTLL